jgi:hypothetical protein
LHADSGVRRAVQPHQRVTDRRAQPLHQMLPPFAHGDPDPGVAIRRLEDLGLERFGHSILEANAFLQPRQRLRRRRSLHFGQVGALHFEAGVGERVGQLPIVRDEQRPLRIEVQASHRKDAPARVLHVLRHRGPALRILHRGDYARRLVEDEVGALLRGLDQLAIHRHQIAPRLHLRPELAHRDVVHRDVPAGDQLFRVPSRGDPRAREVFLQALRHNVLRY